MGWALTESIRAALSSIGSNKLRSTLTMLGVIIGVGAVVAMVAVGEGAREAVTERINSLGSNLLTVTPGRVRGAAGSAFQARGQANLLSYDHLLALKEEALPGIRAVTAEAAARAVVRYGRANTQTQIVGTTPEFPDVRNFHVALGRFLTDYDLASLSQVAVLGQTVVNDLFGPGVNPLGQVIRIGSVPFRVVGVMEEKQQGFGDMGDQILVPITTAQKRLIGNRWVRAIFISAESPEVTSQVAAAVSAFFTRELGDPAAFSLTDQQAVRSTVEAATASLTLMLAGITAISLVVGGIGIMNIMLVSVTERTREIGIRKAIGARRSHILTQFVVEASTLSGLGGVLGIGAGVAAARLMAKLGGWRTVVSWESVGIAFAFSVLVGLVFGIYPAYRASRLNPIEALRYE